MKREDIIRMAREARFPAANYPALVSDGDWGALERFAALVVAASASVEREACAQVADSMTQHSFLGKVGEAIRNRKD